MPLRKWQTGMRAFIAGAIALSACAATQEPSWRTIHTPVDPAGLNLAELLQPFNSQLVHESQNARLDWERRAIVAEGAANPPNPGAVCIDGMGVPTTLDGVRHFTRRYARIGCIVAIKRNFLALPLAAGGTVADLDRDWRKRADGGHRSERRLHAATDTRR